MLWQFYFIFFMIGKICVFFLPLCYFSRVWEQNKLLGKVIACVFSFYKSLARESISISVGSLVGLCQWDGSCIVRFYLHMILEIGVWEVKGKSEAHKWVRLHMLSTVLLLLLELSHFSVSCFLYLALFYCLTKGTEESSKISNLDQD